MQHGKDAHSVRLLAHRPSSEPGLGNSHQLRDKLSGLMRVTDRVPKEAAVEEMVALARSILKFEWERVKCGSFRRPIRWLVRLLRKGPMKPRFLPKAWPVCRQRMREN